MTNLFQKSMFLYIIIFFSISASCQQSSVKNNSVQVVNNDVQNNVDSIQVLKMLFLGDIMEHDLQIQSAYNSKTGTYDFSGQFEDIKSIINNADVTVANFEVTLSQKPYKGYPRFSSPDELAFAVKNAGIEYVALANNHIYDYSQAGFNRTIRVIDSVGLNRTGAFYDKEDRKKHNPMIIEKNGFKIAVFNYTYGVNGDNVSAPSIVNFINYDVIKKDLNDTSQKYDAKIVFFHWGKEYELVPNSEQEKYADFCFDNGADIIIGSHPHVVQPMKFYDYQMPDGMKKRVLIAYSLGNYVSNYGNWRWSDGGALIQFSLQKKNGKIEIKQPEYHLVWVFRQQKGNGLRNYHVLPIKNKEFDKFMSDADKKQRQRFINDYRAHLEKYNVNVPEADLPIK